MRRVYKYDIEVGFPMNIFLSRAKVVLFARQGKTLNIWVENEVYDDPDIKRDNVKFTIYGTGFDIDNPEAEHCASLIDGDYVWHLYMEKS